MTDIQETVIEHCSGDVHATVTAAEYTSANRIRKLAEQCPAEVKIIYENSDGSLLAHVPYKWVTIRPPRKLNLTDEQKRARLAAMQCRKG